MIILIDMDNTIADWDSEFIKQFLELTNKDVSHLVKNRSCFKIEDLNWSDSDMKIVNKILSDGKFYNNLKIYPNAKVALNNMIKKGHQVYIVSSPHNLCMGSSCYNKHIWIKRELGQEWNSRAILSQDKTLISGDILIDDKPEIEGFNKPDFKHVLFNQSYNRKINKKRINNWDQWYLIIES